MSDISGSLLSTITAQQSLLVGIIIDVSSSMKRNWRNKDGRKLPRIEVIRDSLNKYLQEEKFKAYRSSSNRQIELFCLGMGFQTLIHLTDIDLSHEQEHHLKGTLQTRRMVGIVCDLLALSEILPDKQELEHFKDLLDQKWKYCSQGILEQSVIAEDVSAQLVQYIQQGFHKSALDHFHQSIYYRLIQTGIAHRFFDNIDDQIKEREEKIAFLSQTASQEYADTIYQETSRYFTENTPQYVSMVNQHLLTFAKNYITAVLRALTLGFETTELVDDLDEKQALELAKRIQADLEKDVRRHIGLLIVKYENRLSHTGRQIAASLDKKEVRRFTERLIRKAGWDILRPLIEKTVLEIFAQQFEARAKESLPYWIQLASTREVTRSLANLKTVLPEAAENQVYTNDIMFGATPFKLAIEKAAIRLIDPQHREKKKVLLIISDGEFEDLSSSLITVDLLKRRGVVIATGVVGNKNVLSQLVKRLSHAHSSGTKLMFEIASQASDFREEGIPWKEGKATHVLKEEKLCFQVNHSFLLENILELVFTG
ncbi:MAG TPA: vWA domain-containing protein [Ktedonobacteraceae bacterium]|nr:vWA domain-containing protein [Ktedonobacteraceae bacterium]